METGMILSSDLPTVGVEITIELISSSFLDGSGLWASVTNGGASYVGWYPTK
jgi:hypothetical protein